MRVAVARRRCFISLLPKTVDNKGNLSEKDADGLQPAGKRKHFPVGTARTNGEIDQRSLRGRVNRDRNALGLCERISGGSYRADERDEAQEAEGESAIGGSRKRGGIEISLAGCDVVQL
jgi:hypothetical protein